MTEEKEVSISLKPSEIFQLHLCVVSRTAEATIKWCNACSKEEQEYAQKSIIVFNEITRKLENKLKELGNDDENIKSNN